MARMLISGYRDWRFEPAINMLCPWARHFINIASVDSAVKWIPGGNNLVRDVQCYELFGGIALKNHVFLFLLKNETLIIIIFIICIIIIITIIISIIIIFLQEVIQIYSHLGCYSKYNWSKNYTATKTL